MNYAKLAEMGAALSSNATTTTTSRSVSSPVTNVRSSKNNVLDDFIGTRKAVVRDHHGTVRSRVLDKSEKKQVTKKKVTDSVTAEDVLNMRRSERRRFLGSLTPKDRSKMLGEMNKIKDSRRVADAIEDMDGDENKSQLINLVTIINNVKKDDSEFTRKLLAECLETLPEKYADYAYFVIDGEETDLSDEEIDEITVELDDVKRALNIEDSKKTKKRKVSDSVLDDVVETPSAVTDIDSLLTGLGEYLKTGNIDKLAEFRQSVSGGETSTTEDGDEEELTEDDETIQENTDDLFGDGESTDEGAEETTEGGGDDLFGDESDEFSDNFEDADDENLEDVGFEDNPDVIEVPEGVDEGVKKLVQELLDIFSENADSSIEDARMQKIIATTKKMIKDSIDGVDSTENESETITDFTEYQLEDYPTLEATEELVRVPLTYEDYTTLSNADVREGDIKSLMPSYSVCPSTIEPCNSRCVKVTSEDGVVSYWTPICGAVDNEKITTMTCDDLQKSYVPVDAFCGYASKLNQLDLINPIFYKEVVESPVWSVSDDCEQFGLKAGDHIIPDCEGDVKIFDRCYKKVE